MGLTIVVGYDGSDCAKAALDQALGLAGPAGKVIITYADAPPRIGSSSLVPPEKVVELGRKVTAEALRGGPAARRAGRGGPRGRAPGRGADQASRRAPRPTSSPWAPAASRSSPACCSARPPITWCIARPCRCWSCR